MTTRKLFPLTGRRRGVTLIESVLFVSIGLGLIVGGIVFFQQANDASRTNDVVRNISNISNEVRAFYRTQASFDELDNDVVIAAGVVPKTLSVSGSTISNEFGGNYTIVENAGDDQKFDLTTTDVPQAVCTRIAIKDASGNGPVGAFINTIAVNGKAAMGLDDDDLVAVTAADAAGACDDPDDNTIVFTFSR